MNNELQFTDIAAGEESRTYVFANGEYTIKGAKRLCVRPSGSHRVEDACGGKHIVSPGWLAIKVAANDWSL